MNICGLCAIVGDYRQDISIEQMAEEALLGGASMIQLRVKNASARHYIELAMRVKAVTGRCNVPLIINDRADVAFAVGASGVHLGQSDLPIEYARLILGRDAIIGVSVQTVEQAKEAERQGADYLGAGPVFPTISKEDAERPIGLEGLRAICAEVGIPVIAIGGIYAHNAKEVMSAGASGIAAISAIFGADDIEAATKELVEAMKEGM